MSQQSDLIESFATTHWLVSRFSENMSHEDSVAAPPFRANTFNWVLGHVLVSRDRALALLDRQAVLTADETALYDTGSEALQPELAVELGQLLKAMEESQERLTEGLSSASEQDLSAIYDENRNQTIGNRLEGLHWHETYHVGQLEILRQVSGDRDPFP